MRNLKLSRKYESGFTYFGILAAVALLGAVLGSTFEIWHTVVVREKENQLLFVGQQYRTAIGRYYRATPGPIKQYPLRLEDLLEDPRLPGVQRYLRRIYPDPITGTTEWALMKGAQGGIVGLHSLSEKKPLKTAGFDPDDSSLEDAESYIEWVFEYRSQQGPANRNKPTGNPLTN